MARGNCIVVNGQDPKGRCQELIVATGETWYPGMLVQVDPSVALKHGRNTGKIYNRDADGDRPAGPFWLVTELLLAMQGKTTSDSYAAGEHASVYAPLPGDEVNLLYKNVSGTADDVALGDLFIVDDGTGKVIVTTGSPETEVAIAKEAVTDPTADTLVWSEWTGH